MKAGAGLGVGGEKIIRVYELSTILDDMKLDTLHKWASGFAAEGKLTL